MTYSATIVVAAFASAFVLGGCEQPQKVQKAGLTPNNEKLDTAAPASAKDKFELREDKQGRMIRLNKVTGEIAVLEGNALIPVQTPEEAQNYAPWFAQLATPKSWDAIQIPQISKDTTANLTTSWRDAKLHYRFSISPSTEIRRLVMNREGGYFQVLLTDSADFNLVRITVPTNKLVRILEPNGSVSRYEINDSTPCSDVTYFGIAKWNIEWHF